MISKKCGLTCVTFVLQHSASFLIQCLVSCQTTGKKVVMHFAKREFDVFYDPQEMDEIRIVNQVKETGFTARVSADSP